MTKTAPSGSRDSVTPVSGRISAERAVTASPEASTRAAAANAAMQPAAVSADAAGTRDRAGRTPPASDPAAPSPRPPRKRAALTGRSACAAPG